MQSMSTDCLSQPQPDCNICSPVLKLTYLRKKICRVRPKLFVGQKPTNSPGLRIGLLCLLAFVPADGFVEKLGDVVELELFLEACGISLDGLEADVQVVGDLPGAKATAKQLKHFQFAVAQLFDGGSCRCRT